MSASGQGSGCRDRPPRRCVGGTPPCTPRRRVSVRFATGDRQETNLRSAGWRMPQVDNLSRGSRVRILYLTDNNSVRNRGFLEKLVCAGYEVWFWNLTAAQPENGLPNGAQRVIS